MSMNVSGTPSTMLDWTALIGKIGGAKALAEVNKVNEIKTAENQEKQNLTLVTADPGIMAGLAAYTPELQAPKTTGPTAGLSLLNKLEGGLNLSEGQMKMVSGSFAAMGSYSTGSNNDEKDVQPLGLSGFFFNNPNIIVTSLNELLAEMAEAEKQTETNEMMIV